MVSRKLAKNNPERVKLDADKAKDWIKKGAQPSDRVRVFLSNANLIDKPIIVPRKIKCLDKMNTNVFIYVL